MLPEESVLLRIFIGESDKLDGKPLYEWLVVQAKQRGMAGATVLRGMMGFGAHSKIIHTFKIERLSEDLPIVVEIVAKAVRVRKDPDLECGDTGAFSPATTEKVQVRIYRGGEVAR